MNQPIINSNSKRENQINLQFQIDPLTSGENQLSVTSQEYKPPSNQNEVKNDLPPEYPYYSSTNSIYSGQTSYSSINTSIPLNKPQIQPQYQYPPPVQPYYPTTNFGMSGQQAIPLNDLSSGSNDTSNQKNFEIKNMSEIVTKGISQNQNTFYIKYHAKPLLKAIIFFIFGSIFGNRIF